MQNPYRFLDGREVYRGSVFSVREDQIEKPSGNRASFSVIEMKAGASALPITEDGQVYLVREYKYAIRRASLEVASGGLDPGETPLEGAKRELLEEVGITAREWIDLGFIDPYTNQLQGPNYLFLAKGLEQLEPQPDDGEVIEVVKMPFAEAFDRVLRSDITHAGSCALILKAHAFLQASPKPFGVSSERA